MLFFEIKHVVATGALLHTVDCDERPVTFYMKGLRGTILGECMIGGMVG